jgi:hypothetical protein
MVKFDEKREIGQLRGKNVIAKFSDNIWILKSSADTSLPLSHHVENLSEKIGSNMKYFSLLTKNCEVVCQCLIEGDQEENRPEEKLACPFFSPDNQSFRFP